jgi:hypothetical protein
LEAASKSDHEGWGVIDRSTVFQVGARATEPLGAAQTLAAAIVWGTGTSPRWGVHVFDHGTATAGGILTAAARKLRADGPRAAYSYLHGDGGNRNRITHLGPSFGTKFLYFAGYDRCDGDQQPLIFDKNVASVLKLLCRLDWPDLKWTTDQYDKYLGIAHAWAEEWQASPDVVERVLFGAAKADPLAISAFTGLPEIDG